MDVLTGWMMVFLRVSAMLAVFPVFSMANFPVQLRLALGALMAALVTPVLPPALLDRSSDFLTIVGIMAQEVGVGLLFGFLCQIIFQAVDMAGMFIGIQLGLSQPLGVNINTGAQSASPSAILSLLSSMLFLSLNMHHWVLAAFQKSYTYLPVGGAHLAAALAPDMIARTGWVFVVALQMAAPIIAVSFIITLVFSMMSRAVPQMNVFAESMPTKLLVGLAVFGMTLQLISQHIANYLGRLPEDMLRIAQVLGAG